MPAGQYRFDDGTVEEFHCAAGPAGWRYVGTATDGARLDLAVDSRWRQVRVELRAGGWLLRGGVSGRESVWLRAAEAGLAGAREHSTVAAGFTGRSPGLLVATARSLALAAGASERVRLVLVSDDVLATRAVDQEWALVSVDEHGGEDARLVVEEYRLTDLATGLSSSLHVSGDVAVSGPGVELHQLGSAPGRGPDQPAQPPTRGDDSS